MSKSFKKAILCTIVIMLTVFMSIILPFLSYVKPETLNNLNIKSAVADVGGYDIENSGGLSLAGEWEFYWNKHIISDRVKKGTPDLYIDVPSAWTLYTVNGQQLPNGGKASYRVIVKNIKANSPVVVGVENLPGRCRIYIDGQCVFSNKGIYGSTDESVFYTYTDPIYLDSSEHEVVIEVTCDLSSGLTVLPTLSTYHDFRHSEIRSVAIRYMIIGMVVFFAVSIALLAFMSKNIDEHLWLLLLCVIFIVRMLISNEGYMASHMIFGDLNYEIMTSLIFVSTYIIKLCMLMYLNGQLDLKIRQESLVVIAVLFLVCAFVPYFLYDYIYVATTYMWLQAVSYLADGFMVYKLSCAVIDKKRYAIPYMVFYCINAVAIVIDNLYLNGFISGEMSLAMPVACMAFIAFMVFLHMASTVRAYKQAQKTAELQKELSELNTTLMISQIQPHFLYNALNTIKYMTKKDPKVAEGAIVKFSNYLRANMDSLTQKTPIPFPKELEHVKNYIDIEQLRFGDRLKIEYCVEVEDFVIPPLTIQPIVENAIKHGVNQRPEGGTVKISSSETEVSYVIKISDNGVGYDVNEVKNDGRSHVGITNIKKRLNTMLKADVSIKSVVGEGTEVTINIPKNN